MAISQDKVQELLDLIKKLNEKVEAIKNEKINIKLKDDNTPVTKADLLVNDELIKFIKTTQYTKIISEENRQLDFSERTNWEWYWVVDPIDGTKEFIKKGEDYTINIALCHKERPVLALFLDQAMETFTTQLKTKEHSKTIKEFTQMVIKK